MAWLAEEEWGEDVAERLEAIVTYCGSAGGIIHQLVGGLRSGLSYAGVYKIP